MQGGAGLLYIPPLHGQLNHAANDMAAVAKLCANVTSEGTDTIRYRVQRPALKDPGHSGFASHAPGNAALEAEYEDNNHLVNMLSVITLF